MGTRTLEAWGVSGLENTGWFSVAGRATVCLSATQAVQRADLRVGIAGQYLVVSIREVDRAVR